jgi:uncharacterized iron-regulated protein
MKKKFQTEHIAMVPYICLTAFFLIISWSCCALSMATESALPTHKLNVRFNLEEHTLMGTSIITLPAGSTVDIQVGDLQTSKITSRIEGSIEGSDVENPLAAVEGIVKIASTTNQQQITIEYTLKVADTHGYGPQLISPQAISLTGLWHPILATKALFELTAEIPQNFEAVSEADIITTSPLPETKSVHFDFPYPLQYRHFIAGPYVVTKYPFGNNKELYTYFFAEDKELANQYMEKALSYMDRYEKLLGDYPYQRFSVVENRLPTGYAMPTFTLLGQVVVRLPFITDTSLGHEVLHSWFGNSVDTKPDGENWVEGLTTYLADQAYAAEEDKGEEFRKNQLIKYQSHVTGDKAVALKEFHGAGSHMQGGNEAIRAIGYGKASMLFHMLEKQIGAELFQKTLQAFYAVHMHKQANWADIESSFKKVSGKDLTSFFEQWLTRKDVPDLEIRDIKTVEQEGMPEVSFLLVQNTETPYTLEVPITILDERGRIDKTISIDKKETKVKMALRRLPQELILDANYDLMRKLTTMELPPVWSRFVGAEKKIIVTPLADSGKTIYTPLLEQLKESGSTLLEADKAKDSDFADASVIFLGTDTSISRSLFAKPDNPNLGCVIDIRPNPLNPDQVAVLVNAEDQDEMAEAARKLRHYGKYSYLHFMSGEIVDKRITETDNGIRHTLDIPPRAIVTNNTLSFDAIVDKLLETKIVYVGESHTRFQDHVLQLRVIRALYEHDQKLAIGMEMFNDTAQQTLIEYLNGEFDERDFLKKSHYFTMWGYDYQLYRDIINYAKKHKIPIIALNIEKETVSKVYKEGGIGALSPEEMKTLPEERDLTINGYRERIAAVFKLHDSPTKTEQNKLNDFFQAQTIWDETMAESVTEYMKKNPDHRMVVIAGMGHTKKDSGIPPRVARRMSLKQAVILNAEDQSIDPASADYLLFVQPENLPPQPKFGVLLEEKDGKVLLKSVSPHGKANDAGFKENDAILAIDEEPIKTLEDIKITMLYKKMGDKVKVQVQRERALLGDKIMEIEVAF